MPVKDNARVLLTRFERISVENKKIARDMAVIMGFALAAKIVAAAKEIAIAWRFGISEVVDVYLFIFNLANLPVALWYSILTVVFIPLAARLRAEGSQNLQIFSAEVLGLTILAGVGLGLIGWAGLAGLFNSSLSGLSEGTRQLAFHITPWFAILIPLGIVTHYGSVLMMSESRHTNTLFEGIPALGLLAAVTLSASRNVAPLLWGTLAGAVLHMIAVITAAAKSGQITWPRFSMRSPAWKIFWGGFGVMLLGQFLQSLTGIVDQFFAANLGSGSVATLGYANRILSLILTLGATAVARATLPIFSKMQAQGEGAIRLVAMRWAQIMLALGVAALLIGWPTAHWAVVILFQRGAFTAADTAIVAEVLQYALIQVPFYFGSLVVVQGLFSQRRYRFVASISGINLAVKLGASFLLVPLFGLQGLVGATAIMYATSFSILLIGLNRLRTTNDSPLD